MKSELLIEQIVQCLETCSDLDLPVRQAAERLALVVRDAHRPLVEAAEEMIRKAREGTVEDWQNAVVDLEQALAAAKEMSDGQLDSKWYVAEDRHGTFELRCPSPNGYRVICDDGYCDEATLRQMAREHNSHRPLVEACTAAMDEIGPSEREAELIDMLDAWRKCQQALAAAKEEA